MKFKWPIIVLVLLAIGIVILLVRQLFSPLSDSSQVVPTPTPQQVEQLAPDKYPSVSLAFTPDGHFVTIKLANLFAVGLEYNLIYDALVKKNQIQTGVTGSTKLDGLTEYSNKQLLGSESSGKFTYHENIANAVLELTLRNSAGYSIFSGTYPFTVSPGKTIEVAIAQ